MTFTKNGMGKTILLLSLTLILLSACTFPDSSNSEQEQTEASQAETVATLGSIASSDTQTTESTEAQSTARGPVDDGYPNETEEGDTKRY